MQHRTLTPNVWALVLAGGDGTRLASVTRDDRGLCIPKQFCSLTGGPTLLDDALRRAACIAPRGRTCIVVGRRHQRYWEGVSQKIGTHNVIKEPRNCGTGIGILFALLHVLRRDPLARIVFLPSDHYVRNEAVLRASLREAVSAVACSDSGLVLIGIEPEGVDSDLGYIVPGKRRQAGTCAVDRFVEKPDMLQARELLSSGAVWNSFIFAATGTTLLGLLRARLSEIVPDMWNALGGGGRASDDGRALQALYETLPTVDFSRDILQGNEGILRLLTAPVCGWNDLGTPSRLARVVATLGEAREYHSARTSVRVTSVLNLAARCKRLSMGSELTAAYAA